MITKTNNRTKLAVSGVEYDFDFRIDDATELEVYGIASDGTSTELTTGFSISFDTANEEGTVTFDSEPSTYAEILMLRDRAYTQDTDIPIRGGFSEEDIEKALDQIVIQIQQLKELTDYSVKQDLTTTAVNVVLPAPEDGLALVWSGTSGAMQNAPVDAGAIADGIADAQAAQAAAEAAQAAAEAAAAAIDTYASQAEAEAGLVENKVMNPLRTAQAIAALATQVGLGDWASFTPGTVYQAATDVFVMANGGLTNTAAAGSIALFSDDSNPPTTYLDARNCPADGTGNSRIGVTCFVKKGKYWKVTAGNLTVNYANVISLGA